MKPVSTNPPTGPAWYWAIPVAFILPFLHAAIFTLRFGSSKVLVALTDSAIFLPGGLIGGLAIIYLLRQRLSNPSKLVAGFVSGIPFAFILSLLMPLFMPALIGATLGVAVPLLAGLAFGHFYKTPDGQEKDRK